jgi:hypothetical protein
MGSERSLTARKTRRKLSPTLPAALVTEIANFYLAGAWRGDLWPAAATLPASLYAPFTDALRGNPELPARLLLLAAEQGHSGLIRAGGLLKAVYLTSNVPGLCKSIPKKADKLELKELQSPCAVLARQQLPDSPIGHDGIMVAYACLLVATQGGAEPQLAADWRAAAKGWGDSAVVERVLKASAKL